MAGEWRESTIGEEVDILLGFAFKSAEFATEPPGHRLVRGDNVKRGTIEWGDKSRYRRQPSADLDRYSLRVGDVVVGMDGSRVGENFARITQADLPAFLVQRVACLRGKPNLDQAFLRYLICNPDFTAYIKAVHTGTSIPHISGGQIAAYPIAVPPRDEQRAIAHILGTLDDKIELNRRMNETLEAMARALFQSWFVDFDPVRAKAEGRNPGLPKHVVDLFPASFVDSELGEVPKGWRVAPLGDLAGYISRGVGPAYIDAGGILVLNQKCIRDRRVDFSKARRHDASKKAIEDRRLRVLDIVINSTGVGTLGRVAQIWDLPEEAIVDSHVSIVRAAEGTDPWFLGVMLLGREIEIEALGEGSTGQTELSRARLSELPCLAPSAEVQHSFGQQVAPMLARITEGERESRSLAALRDALLPKLISGELWVEAPERFIRGSY